MPHSTCHHQIPLYQEGWPSGRGVLITLLAFLLCSIPLATHAAPSDPVGALRLKLLGNSDTIVSLPLHRPALLQATLASRSGNQLTLDATAPNLPVGGAYALIMTGALEGAVLPIASAADSTITVDSAGNNLASLSASDVVAIIPYWTLDTVFPSGAGVNASASMGNRATEILLYSNTVPGTNIAPSSVFFYFVGNQFKAAGWYNAADISAPQGSRRLPPNTYFVVRHKTDTTTYLTVAGAVQMAGYRVPVSVLSGATSQDNFVSLPVALPVVLGSSELISSGAFAASPTLGANRADELLVYNNAAAFVNKAPSATYFYFAGSPFKSAGWYNAADISTTAENFALKPGEGFIIRKRQSTPRTDMWSGVPNYLQ